MAAVTAVPGSRESTVDLQFAMADGVVRREPLAQCSHLPFEFASPARMFASYRGQRNFPGMWWSTTMRTHVGFESWLERDHAMLLDFDPGVVAYSSQPFWLMWLEGRRWRRHAPVFFVRRADGCAVVIDVRPDCRVELRDAAAFEACAHACASVGWAYDRVGEFAPVHVANLRWLAGYRHSRCFNAVWAKALRHVFSTPRALGDGVDAVGDPIAVLPVLFHLMWRSILIADLHALPLSGSTVVAGADAD